MSLASNQKEQMAKRLKADLALLAPELAAASLQDSDSNPVIQLKDGSDVVALAAIKRRSFNGFNVVAELSASAGEGYPEHELWLAVIDTTTLARQTKLTKLCAEMGCSSMKLVVTEAAPALADLVDANVSLELPNSARLGSVGN